MYIYIYIYVRLRWSSAVPRICASFDGPYMETYGSRT